MISPLQHISYPLSIDHRSILVIETIPDGAAALPATYWLLTQISYHNLSDITTYYVV